MKNVNLKFLQMLSALSVHTKWLSFGFPLKLFHPSGNFPGPLSPLNRLDGSWNCFGCGDTKVS